MAKTWMSTPIDGIPSHLRLNPRLESFRENESSYHQSTGCSSRWWPSSEQVRGVVFKSKAVHWGSACFSENILSLLCETKVCSPRKLQTKIVILICFDNFWYYHTVSRVLFYYVLLCSTVLESYCVFLSRLPKPSRCGRSPGAPDAPRTARSPDGLTRSPSVSAREALRCKDSIKDDQWSNTSAILALQNKQTKS